MAISFVQSTSGVNLGGGTNTTPTAAFVSANTAGNAVIVGTIQDSQSGTTSVTDTTGNTYTLQAKFPASGNRFVEIWACLNIGAAGANTNIVTLNQGFHDSIVFAHEYSGLSTTSALDKTGSGTSFNASPTATTAATTQASELVFACLEMDIFSANTIDSGDTNYSNFQKSATNFILGAVQSRIVSSTGAQTSIFNVSNAGGGTWRELIATFKAAAGGGSSVSDSATTSEGVQLEVDSFLSLNDPTNTTEVVSPNMVSNPLVSDSSTLSESLGILEGFTINVSDSTTTSESISPLLIKSPIVTDNVSIQEQPTLLLQSFTTLSDSTTTSENTSVLIASPVSVSDSTATSENSVVFVPNLDPVVSDSTTLSESAIVNLPTSGTSTIVVSDASTTSENTVVQEITAVNVSDSTVTSEALNINEIDLETKSDTVTTSENTVVQLNSFVSKSDSTTTSENVVVFQPALAINKSESVTTSESLGLLNIEFISIQQTSSTSENMVVNIATVGTRQIAVSDSTTTSEFVDVLKIREVKVSDATTTSENMQIIVYVDPESPLQFKISTTGTPNISNTRF